MGENGPFFIAEASSTPDRAPVCARGFVDAAADGTGFRGPRRSELPDCYPCADPSDKMYPPRHVRVEWEPVA